MTTTFANPNLHLQHVSFDSCRFHIHYWGESSRHFNNQLHQHSFWEAVLILSGTGSYLQDGVNYPLQEHTLLLSRPKIPHQILSQQGMNILFVGFEPDWSTMNASWRSLFQSILSNPQIVRPIYADHYLVRVWQEIHQTAEHNTLLLEEKMLGLAKHILLYILGEYHRSTLPLDLHKPADINHDMSNIKKFIQDNINHDLKLEEIAELFYMSSRNISRMFTRYENVTFTEYKTKVRMDMALNLLQNTHHTISEISCMTGFSTVQYFSAAFTKYMNLSPLQYKKKYLKSGDSIDNYV